MRKVITTILLGCLALNAEAGSRAAANARKRAEAAALAATAEAEAVAARDEAAVHASAERVAEAAAAGITIEVPVPSTSSTLRALTSDLSDLTASLRIRLGAMGGAGAMPEDMTPADAGARRTSLISDDMGREDAPSVAPHGLKIAQQEGLEREQAVMAWVRDQGAREECALDAAAVHRIRMAAMAAHGRTGEELTVTLSKYTLFGVTENLDRIFMPVGEGVSATAISDVSTSTVLRSSGFTITAAVQATASGGEDPSNDMPAVSAPAPGAAPGRGIPPLGNGLHGEDE